MARDDVFGIVSPCAATIGTTIMEVRFPGMPPIQCLSTTDRSFHLICVPAFDIARISARSSSLSHEARGANQERSNLHVGIPIVRKVFDDRHRFPEPQESGPGSWRALLPGCRGRGRRDRHLAPAGSAKRRKAVQQARVVWSRPNRHRRSIQSRQQLFEFRRISTRLKPRNTSGRRAVDRREITTTFSRPVSRLIRRDLSWGRVGVISVIWTRYRHRREPY